MFETYGYLTEVNLIINTADDSRKSHTTKINIYSTYPINTRSDELDVHASLVRGSIKGEPLILGIKNYG